MNFSPQSEMTDGEESRLGNALTILGLEDKFLVNGMLANFPLAERGRIAQQIIDEKLRLGKWERVIEMIYGGFGKADALFEGDRDALNERIVASARDRPRNGVTESVLTALIKADQHDLVFRLAVVAEEKYEFFRDVVQRIPRAYFKDPEQGKQRELAANRIGSEKALAEGRYDCALKHFAEVNDSEGIMQLFNMAIAADSSTVSFGLLEAIAVADPSQKMSRLQTIVKRELSSKADEVKEGNGLPRVPSPRFSYLYKLVREHNLSLTDEQKVLLRERVVEELGEYSITRDRFAEDTALQLLWARKNATSNPKKAYELFSRLGYEGEELILAVQEGLKLRYGECNRNVNGALIVDQVAEEHLRRASSNDLPFDVQVQIASHLKNKPSLQSLSREARERNEFDDAYHLWVAGEGDLDGEYIASLRARLIEEELKSEYPNVDGHFLASKDTAGTIQAYDALMEQQRTQGERRIDRLLKAAYNLAINMGDEERTQRTREAMFAINPDEALEVFKRGSREGERDKKGIAYIVDTVASAYGVEPSTLGKLVEQYR